LKDLGVSENEVLKYILKVGPGWSELWTCDRKILISWKTISIIYHVPWS
jgi:hypothetical protein